MRVAIVGLGPMGLRHVHAWARLSPPPQLAALVRHDRDAARLHDAPFVQHLADMEQLQNFQPDLTIVAVATPDHFAVAAGLPGALLVEKPLCQTPDQAQTLLARSGRVFVGHTSRAEAGAIALHRVIAQGVVGAAQAISIAGVEPALQRPGAGVPQHAGRLCDVLVHALALAVELVPAADATTVATALQLGPEGPQLQTALQWPNGQRLQVAVAAHGQAGRHVHVSGERGALSWDVLPGHSQLTLQVDRAPSPLPCGGPAPLVALADHIAAALPTHQPTPFDGAWGLRVLQLCGQIWAAVPAEQLAGGWQWSWLR